MKDHTANCLLNSLEAAQKIATAMCVFKEDHHGQTHLVDALHCALIVAEECRQAWKERSARAVKALDDDGEPA